MSRKTSSIALCAASALPLAGSAGEGDVPEWVHLLPPGPLLRTVDGRGPYRVVSLQAVADRFVDGDRLPIDECHATDRAAPMGLPAPARGWIVGLQAREDGLWGRVEWTGTGRELMADRAYKGISPAILYGKDGVVQQVLRASLINTPNLQGLVALNSQENASMDFRAMLIELLGLDSSADDAAISAALKAKLDGGASANAVDLCSQVMEHPTFVALQSEAAATAAELATLREERSRERATAFVDGAIAAGHVGVKPARDEYIALHMAEPTRAEKMIGALPKVSGDAGITGAAPAAEPGQLDATDRQVIALFGVDEEAYAAGLNGRGQKKEAL